MLLLGIGLAIYRDYGVFWDEGDAINIGSMNGHYIDNILANKPAQLTFDDRYHGPIFEVMLWYLTRDLPNPEMVYSRHLVTFLVFTIGVIALYILAYRLFRKSWWSLLTVILLVLSPRIFADSFYNSKDIPFLAFFTIAILLLLVSLDVVCSERNWIIKAGTVVLSAIAGAIATDIRLPGVVLIPLTCSLLVLVALLNSKRWKDIGVLIPIYLLFAFGFVIIFWPALWHNLFSEFIKGFVDQSHFPWPGSVLFGGQYIKAVDLPWQYIPTWISISTPLLQLGGFIPGIFSLALVSERRSRNNSLKQFRLYLNRHAHEILYWLALIAWLVLPLAAILILHSVVYDGWRQMFFIYPSILLIAVFGLKTAYENLSNLLGKPIWFNVLAGAILIAGLLEPLIFIVQYHPNENVYFNFIAGDPAILRQKFDQDYWGLSYKQGIDFILANDPSKKINIAIADLPGNEYIKYMLAPEQASRLNIIPLTNLTNGDYFITTYRFHPDDYSFGEDYYSLSIRGTIILTVYKK